MLKDVKVSAENQTGVTILELLVVMAIIGIIIAVGVNMMGGVITKQRIRTTSGEVQTRLRVAQMLSVVKNEPVTVVFVNSPGIDRGQEDSYYACISAPDGTCDEFVNLDSGKTSTLELATNTLHPLVDMYEVNFGADTPNAVTFIPPSGLPRTIEDDGTPPAIINGVVCFRVEAGDEGRRFRRPL